MLRWVAVAGFMGGIGAAVAEPVRMSADDIKRVMQPGAVLAIDTPLSISIPVTVAPNGMVAGEAGALGLTLGAMKDRGRWWTERDQLCMKWFRWFDAKPRCITLRRDGDKVYWYENSGESGTATISEAPTVQIAKQRAPQNVELASVERQEPAPERAPKASGAESRFATPTIINSAAAAEQPQPSGPAPQSEFSSEAEPSSPPAATSTPAARAATPKAQEPPAARRQPVVKAPAAPLRAASVAAPRKPSRPPAPKDATASISSMALASFRVSRVVEGDMLNVRAGPSEYHDQVGAIPARGRGVQIVGACRELWCPIRHGSLKGWVNRYYLAEDAGQATSSKH